MKNNKYLSYALGILFSFCLIVTLLITSVEAVTYWTPGYYEREYSKYNVIVSNDVWKNESNK